ncbi:hypothetical protein HDV00_011673 [Rhizophlyctis rosea]|nr:hypothetical protein HDV00_011673 [Rhizophlyctis rosea]
MNEGMFLQSVIGLLLRLWIMGGVVCIALSYGFYYVWTQSAGQHWQSKLWDISGRFQPTLTAGTISTVFGVLATLFIATREAILVVIFFPFVKWPRPLRRTQVTVEDSDATVRAQLEDESRQVSEAVREGRREVTDGETSVQRNLSIRRARSLKRCDPPRNPCSVLRCNTPGSVYIADNGSSEEEIKKTEEICWEISNQYLCQHGYESFDDIPVPGPINVSHCTVGSKNLSQFMVGFLVAEKNRDVQFVTIMDDDTLIPEDWQLDERYRILETRGLLDALHVHDGMFTPEDLQLGLNLHTRYNEPKFTPVANFTGAIVRNDGNWKVRVCHYNVGTVAPVHFMHITHILPRALCKYIKPCNCGENSLWKQRKFWESGRFRYPWRLLTSIFHRTKFSHRNTWAAKIWMIDMLVATLNDWVIFAVQPYIFITAASFTLYGIVVLSLFSFQLMCYSLFFLRLYFDGRAPRVPYELMVMYPLMYSIPSAFIIKIPIMFWSVLYYIPFVHNTPTMRRRLREGNMPSLTGNWFASADFDKLAVGSRALCEEMHQMRHGKQKVVQGRKWDVEMGSTDSLETYGSGVSDETNSSDGTAVDLSIGGKLRADSQETL